jgi:UDP-N-acetylmuramate--alanine ligase
VGGKSTVTAMITWILEKSGHSPSFSVGVGGIVGMKRTGVWNPQSQFFIAEADEYVTDPAAVAQGEKAIPRFSYLKPFITVCTHIKYDHPDVYASEQDTVNAYQQFFSQISSDGILILNEIDLPKQLTTSAATTYTFGTSPTATLRYTYLAESSLAGVTMGNFWYQNQEYVMQLSVPGEYNLENSAAATLACLAMGIPIETSIAALATFASTIRRFEYKGEINGVKYYDDYGHHPSELTAVITAAYAWYSPDKLVIAFQPHTYSRTKHLFTEFVAALAKSNRLVLLDIFASAREAFDPSVSSQQLAEAVAQQNPSCNVTHLATIKDLEQYCKTQLHQGDVLLTMGAGDIYHVHELLRKAS